MVTRRPPSRDRHERPRRLAAHRVERDIGVGHRVDDILLGVVDVPIGAEPEPELALREDPVPSVRAPASFGEVPQAGAFVWMRACPRASPTCPFRTNLI